MSNPVLRSESKKLIHSLATQYALDYCASHGLSKEKLKKQRFDIVLNRAIFSQPSSVAPDGLRNDMKTLPTPTLVITMNDGDLSIEETKDTKRFLGDD